MAPRLLYVDDEDDLRMLVQCQLALHGYQVDVAADGVSALEQAKNTPYDLVLLDIHLPGKMGTEVAAELRRTESPSRVVILSGEGAEEARGHCRNLGVTEFLAKPFHFRELVSTIERALTAPSAGPHPSAVPPKKI